MNFPMFNFVNGIRFNKEDFKFYEFILKERNIFLKSLFV